MSDILAEDLANVKAVVNEQPASHSLTLLLCDHDITIRMLMHKGSVLRKPLLLANAKMRP